MKPSTFCTRSSLGIFSAGLLYSFSFIAGVPVNMTPVYLAILLGFLALIFAGFCMVFE
jgi:hypothetical protein